MAKELNESQIKLKLNREYLCGKRVEIAPGYDLWMRGARYGQVHSVYTRNGRTLVAVKMDHPQVRKLARLPIEDVTII